MFECVTVLIFVFHHVVVFGRLLSSNRRARMSGFPQKWAFTNTFFIPCLRRWSGQTADPEPGFRSSGPWRRRRSANLTRDGSVRRLEAYGPRGLLPERRTRPAVLYERFKWVASIFFNYDLILLFCRFFIFDTSNQSIVPTLCCHFVLCELVYSRI